MRFTLALLQLGRVVAELEGIFVFACVGELDEPRW